MESEDPESDTFPTALPSQLLNIGLWMREWSIVMDEIRILYRAIVRNLNLLRGYM